MPLLPDLTPHPSLSPNDPALSRAEQRPHTTRRWTGEGRSPTTGGEENTLLGVGCSAGLAGSPSQEEAINYPLLLEGFTLHLETTKHAGSTAEICGVLEEPLRDRNVAYFCARFLLAING